MVYSIEGRLAYNRNYIKFSYITSIIKTQTLSPVEVIVIDCDNHGHVIAELQPNQRFSKYRKYLAPRMVCGHKSIHGIFKIAQQEIISSPTDKLIISNEEALVSLCKGVFNLYYKEQVELGDVYLKLGIQVLEDEKREEESPSESPIQVSHLQSEDIPEIFKFNS